MYRTYNARPIPRSLKPHKKRLNLVVLVGLLLIIAGYIAFALFRPVPPPKTTILPPVIPAQVRVSIPWPSSGHAAFGADGYGILASHKEQKPMPTASVTKIVTAMAILEKKPLKKGEAGPAITMTAKDTALYYEYIAKDGAVVPVSDGQTISQYQALQAILLPSANNIADSTVLWAFGSMEAYTAYANQMVQKLGMTRTTISDASGFSPQTVSTPTDLVRLGDAALDHPVIAEIISQKQASFPGYGTIHNVNSLLGQSGIRGIKTGNTDEAGGCYLSAADITVAGEKITVITAVMGSTSRPQAMKDSLPMVQSAVSQFHTVPVVKEGQSVGRVTSAWGQSSEVVATKSMSVVTWTGTAVAPKATAEIITVPTRADTPIGKLTLRHRGHSFESTLETTGPLYGPSIWWRLSHPF